MVLVESVFKGSIIKFKLNFQGIIADSAIVSLIAGILNFDFYIIHFTVCDNPK